MANMELLVKAWDVAHWELGEAFKGLPDADVWTRPHRKLSVGELAAHIAYGESAYMTGGKIASPLNNALANYYTDNLETPFQADLGAEELYKEVERVHEAAKTALLAETRDSADPNPLRGEWTWGQTLEYAVFHVSYHAGQIYSVRHLLGHQTEDN